MVGSSNPDSVIKTLITSEIDVNKLNKDLTTLEKAIQVSEKSIETMRVNSTRIQATLVQELTAKQKESSLAKLKGVQDGLRIESNALNTLKEAYSNYYKLLSTYANEQVASTNKIALQSKIISDQVSKYAKYEAEEKIKQAKRADDYTQELNLQHLARLKLQAQIEENINKNLGSKTLERDLRVSPKDNLRDYESSQYKAAMQQMRIMYQEEQDAETTILKNAIRNRIALMKQSGISGFNKMSQTANSLNSTSSDDTYGIHSNTSLNNIPVNLKNIVDSQNKVVESTKRMRLTWDDAWERGSTFGHKVATTMQYTAAGAGIYSFTAAISSMTSAFLESDKALHMFKGILELTDEQAKRLQKSVYSIGSTYGGQISELNEAALSLGRAGIEGDKLGTALKSVSQLSLVSGESLNTVTDVLVSWQTLYPAKSIGEVGDILVKVANETKASVADFTTMSTYMLTAGQQAGLTAEAIASLGGSFRQIGKGASTSGTEIRRFFQQLDTGSKDVRQAWSNLGVNLDQLKSNLQQGSTVAEDSLKQLFNILKNKSPKEANEALSNIEQVLDKATIKSFLAVAKASGEGGKALFDSILQAAHNSKGAAEKAGSEVALSYSIGLERVKNTLYAGATEFGNKFTKALSAGTNAKEFNDTLDTIGKNFSVFMGTLGETIGGIATNIGPILRDTGSLIATVFGGAITVIAKLIEGITQFSGTLQFALNIFLTYKMLSVVTNAVTAFGTALGIVGTTSVATTTAVVSTRSAITAMGTTTTVATGAMARLNAVMMANPLFFGAAAIVASIYAVDTALRSMFDTDKEKEEHDKRTAKYKYLQDAFDKSRLPTLVSLNNELEKETKTLESYKKAQEIITSKYGKESEAAKNYQLSIDNSTKKVAKLNSELMRQSALYDIDVQKKNGTYKAPSIAVPDIAGVTPVNLKDSEINRAAREHDRLLKKQLETKIALSNETEAEYLFTNRISDSIATADYHLSNTLPNQIEVTAQAWAQAKTAETREELEAKLLGYSKEYLDTSRKTTLELEKREVTANRILEDTSIELIGIGNKTEEYRIQEAYLKQINIITKDIEDTKAGGRKLSKTDETGYKNRIALAEKERDFKTEMLEINRRIAARDIRTATNRRLEDMKLMTEYQKYSISLNREADDIEQIIADKKERNIALTDEDTANQEKANALRKIASHDMYIGMQLQEAMQGRLNSGLTDFFDIQSEGWMNFEKLGMSVLSALMQEMIKLSVVNPLAQGLSAGIGAGFSALMSGFTGTTPTFDAPTGGSLGFSGNYTPQAIGGVWENGHVSKYAKGGTFTNQLVNKPTYFSSGGTLGLMGEAGPEAILPLRRTASGDLGVVANGNSSGGVQSVQVNIKNESGETLAVTKSESKTDMANMVLDIWIDAVQRNKKGVRDIIRR